MSLKNKKKPGTTLVHVWGVTIFNIEVSFQISQKKMDGSLKIWANEQFIEEMEIFSDVCYDSDF